MSGEKAFTVQVELHYQDPLAALDWLRKAFGFETRLMVRDEHGDLVFAEAGLEGGYIAIVPEKQGSNRSPKSIGGVSTQTVRVSMSTDVDAHCERARQAGAVILMEPQMFFFGDKTYVALDPEGHMWSFAQRVPGAGGPPPKGWTVDVNGRT